MSLRLLPRLPATLILAGLLATVAAGQARQASNRTGAAPFQDPTASIGGTLVDSLGQPVSTAKVTVTSAELGIERRAQTDDQGYFYIPFLQPATYTLLIEMSGFGTIRVSELALQSGMTSALSLTLSPRGAKEVIDVKATPSAVDASNATIKYAIPGKQLESFPMTASPTGRTILDSLPLFLPGISPAFTTGIRGEGLVVNGARPLSNSFSIEGGDNNDYEMNRAAVPFPNPDALQEVTVITNNYKADVGGVAGAVIDATVKQGTNRFHGNLRYFVQAPELTARNFFHTQQYPFNIGAFGGQVGGPISIPGIYDGRDRTHFFFDAEDNYTGGASDYYSTTLSMDERSGHLSTINLPGALAPKDPRTGALFPNGIIPPDRFDPIALYYLNNVFPLPEVPAPDTEGDRYNVVFNTFQAHSLWRAVTKQYTVRIDQVLGHNDNLTGVLFVNLYDRLTSQSGGSRLRNDDLISHGLNAVAHETHTFNVTTVNQLTASFSRYPEANDVEAPGIIGVPPGQVGFTGISKQNTGLNALPLVSLVNSHWFGASLAYVPYLTAGVTPTGGTAKTTTTFKDDLVRALGKHILKAGGGTRFFSMDRSDEPISGVFSAPRNGFFGFGMFNPNGTGNPVADFLLGLPMVYGQSTGLSNHLGQHSYSLYLLDDWRLRPSLTLNLGLRYELTPPLSDRDSVAMVFRPGTHSLVVPNAPEGLLFPGDKDPILGQVPGAGYRTSWTDFAPRFGIALSPRPRSGLLNVLLGDAKTAIRAGFGMFYNPTYGFDSSKVSRAAPFSESLFFQVDKDGSFANPFGKRSSPFPVLPGQFALGYAFDIYTFDPRFRTAYAYQYNFSIQRELPASMLLELQYVGSKSFRLDREFDDNPYFSSTLPFHPPVAHPQFGHIYVQTSDGRANHNSFQARLSRKFKTGLMLDMSYVFSKSLDNSSGPTFDNTSFSTSFSSDLAGFSDPYAWGRSEFDRQQAFVAFYAYDLPTHSGGRMARMLLNGWQIGGITQLRSGRPLDIQGISLNGRPNIVGPFRKLDPRRNTVAFYKGFPVWGYHLFDPASFDNPDPNSPQPIGNLGRNVFSGPGLNLTSLSIVKRSQLSDRQELELRADVSNAFNQTNFDPNSVNTSTGYFLGQVQGALPGRAIQLSIRYKF